ncbi:MAG: SDR family NAD(P)-dependent oxidoreductase [Mycobacterium sp.]
MGINTERFGPWAVVTGASSGIGREFAHQLAAAHINVVLIARRLATLQNLGAELADRYSVEFRAVGADLTDAAMLERVAANTDDLDVGLLVSNAGALLPGAFLDSNLGAQHEVLRINSAAHLSLTHHFGQRLAQRGRGGIVLVSALGASNGVPYLANTAATKAYIATLGAGLHAELGKHGVHVTVLLPGATRTPAMGQLGLDPAKTPGVLEPEQCAKEALLAVERNRANCIPGRINRATAALAPAALTRAIMSRQLSRNARAQTPTR